MKKFTINLCLIIFSLITFISSANALEQIIDVILPESSFFDVNENYWAFTEIDELRKLGILKGYPNHKFNPEATITRAEFATLAVRALKLDDKEVIYPLGFDDFFPEDWAWEYVQNAYFFGLFTPPRANKYGYYFFNPDEPIKRGYAITIAVNALKTAPLSRKKAKAVLEEAYDDSYNVSEHFLIPTAKAQILDMLAIDPRKPKLLNLDKPITRAEAAVLLYNMIEEAKVIPNDKIAASITKKKSALGHVIQDAIVDGDIATIPKGTVLPLILTTKFTSQKSHKGEEFTALVPKNFVTARHYLLLPAGTKFKGYLSNTKKAHFIISNGALIFENSTLEVSKQFPMALEAIAEIYPKNINAKYRKIFKGEKVSIDRGQFLELKILQDIKIDLTTGKLIRYENL